MVKPVRAKPASAAPRANHVLPGAVAILGWGLLVLGYLVLFYSTPLSHAPGGRPVPRGILLLTAFTPEVFLETWTGGPMMQPRVLDRVPVLIAAVFVLLVAYGAGRLVLESPRPSRVLTRLEGFVFAELVGLNMISLLSLGLGLAGWHNRAGAWIAVGVSILAANVVLVLKRRRPDSQTSVSAERPERTPRWFWLGAPIVLTMFLGAMLPPWEFDVREYHLQVPKEWFLQGKIDFLPHNVYGNMPLGAEVLSLPAMATWPGERSWWWGALVGKTVMACFAPLTALALFAAGKRFFSPLAGVIAALIYISIPWVAHTAMAGLNDHVLACYVFLAFYALLLWRSEPSAMRFLLLSGFLAGAAAACKYTGVLFAIAPLGFLTVLFAIKPEHAKTNADSSAGSKRLARPLFAACGFAAFAAVACFPWYAKNWVLSGNPVYPLAYELFDGRTRTPEKAEQWRRAHQVPRSEEDGPYSPGRLAESIAQVGWRSDWLSPILVPLLMLAPLQLQNRRLIAFSAGMMLFLLAVWWLFTHRIDRFWIPALPLAALLAGAGASWRQDRAWRNLALTTVALGLVANWLVIASPWIGDNRFLVSLEDLRTDVSDPATEYIGRVNAAHGFLNQMVPESGAVLLVGDAQPFDLERRVFYDTCFDDNLFEKLTKGRTAAECRRAFEQLGITHVYLNWREIARYRSPGNYGFTDYVQPERFQDLVAQGLLREVWRQEGSQSEHPRLLVYEVASSQR